MNSQSNNSSSQISVLLIGLGQIGMGYDLNLKPDEFVLTHARAASVHKNFSLVGGVDSEKEKRKLFEKTYDCPSFEKLEDAIQDTKPDLVIIATPTKTHLETVNLIFGEYSPKAILCEKPIADNKADAEEILQLCAQNKTRLYVNYHRRSDLGTRKVKELLEGLPKGEKMKGVTWYSKGITNNGSHFLNVLNFWLGNINGFSIIQNGRYWQETDPEPDVLFRFDRGDVVFLSAKEENFSQYTIELINSQGRLRYDMGGKKITWNKKEKSKTIPGYIYLSEDAEEIQNSLNFSQLNVYEELHRDLAGMKAEFCSGEEAMQTLNILNQVMAEL